MSSGHLFFCITRVHNQTLSSQNLQPKKAQVSPAPALCSTLSPDETAFNSFIFFAWPIHTPAFLSFPSRLYSYSPFYFLYSILQSSPAFPLSHYQNHFTMPKRLADSSPTRTACLS